MPATTESVPQYAGGGADVPRLLALAHEAQRRGAWPDAQRHCDAAFSLLTAAGEAGWASDVLYRAGWQPFFQGDLEAAEEAFSASLTIAEINGITKLASQAHVGLAVVEFRRGHLVAAERIGLAGRALAEDAGDERLLALLDTNLAAISSVRGDIGTAIMRYAGAIDRYCRLGDENNRARALANLAKAHIVLAEWDEAAAALHESGSLAEALGDQFLKGAVLTTQAQLHLKRGQPREAEDCCDRALDAMQELGANDWLADIYTLYGAAHREQGEAALAEAHFAVGLHLAERCADPLRLAEVETERAVLFLATDREALALRALNRAHEAFAELGARREVADVRQRLDEVQRMAVLGAKEWAATIDRRDRYEPGHADDVARYASSLARAVGITGADLHWITVGAYLHDVGKAAVPIELLTKPGPLRANERELVHLHAVAGEELVRNLGLPYDVAGVVRHHHERWDGRGYPDGLAGERIPLGARIVSVASIWSALTRERSFRSALSRDEALQLMEREAGRVTDPTLLEAFREIAARESPKSHPFLGADQREKDDFVLQLQRALGRRYQLVREIARGGMSRIFLASEPLLGRDVVVKAVPPGPMSEESRRRFKQEMIVTARLQHPNILPILSSGVRDSVLFYVMPHVAGESLRQHLDRRGPLPLDVALRVVDELLDVLEYAHARGVVHRDIKPDNILLQQSHAVLADFGVARVLSETRLTKTGVALGTPGYMPPEQIFGERSADTRVDIYALGMVAYEVLAGRHPFAGSSAPLMAHLVEEVPPLSASHPGVPLAVSDAIAKAIARDAEQRHQSATEFRRALTARTETA